MTVKDLIKELNKFNPNAEVICYTEEEELVHKNNGFRLLEIEYISRVMAVPSRTKDHAPSLILEDSSLAKEHVLINVIADF